MSCTFLICSKNYYLLCGIVSLLGSSHMVDMEKIITIMDYSGLINSLEDMCNRKRSKIFVIMDSHFVSFEKKKHVSFYLNRLSTAEIAFLLLSDKKRPLRDGILDKKLFNLKKVLFRVCFYSSLPTKNILNNIFEIRYLLYSGGLGKERNDSGCIRMSEKEICIMCWLMDGWSLHEIADRLMIAYKTATVYKSNIVKKFNCKTFRELYLLMN